MIDPDKENQAIDHLEKLRWFGSPECPHCGSSNVIRLQEPAARLGLRNCRDCRRQFTVLVKTPMHRSHLLPSHWVAIIESISTHKTSALQLSRAQNITYKSAYLARKRAAEFLRTINLAAQDDTDVLRDIAEATSTNYSSYLVERTKLDRKDPNVIGWVMLHRLPIRTIIQQARHLGITGLIPFSGEDHSTWNIDYLDELGWLHFVQDDAGNRSYIPVNLHFLEVLPSEFPPEHRFSLNDLPVSTA